jgi:hypothetical protein
LLERGRTRKTGFQRLGRALSAHLLLLCPLRNAGQRSPII